MISGLGKETSLYISTNLSMLDPDFDTFVISDMEHDVDHSASSNTIENSSYPRFLQTLDRRRTLQEVQTHR